MARYYREVEDAKSLRHCSKNVLGRPSIVLPRREWVGYDPMLQGGLTYSMFASVINYPEPPISYVFRE